MVFQGSALFDSLSVWENVAFRLLMTRQVSKEEAYAKALETLEKVQLDATVAPLLPSDLSGGMKRRVALARAIILKPKFLFLDEPTAGLDPPFSRLIGGLIRECHQSLGSVTFTITHDLHLARAIGNRIGMLERGGIVWFGTPQELSTSSHPAVSAFVADGLT
jgi:phospholipid/cholesterol/gamma-HCH transport system ATP-binding protein